MLSMEHIYHIKYEYENKAKSIRKIATETGHSPTTVHKIINTKEFNQQLTPKQRRNRKSNKYDERIKAWLVADQTAPRKQRHTAHRVYTRLLEELPDGMEELDVTERTIRNSVKRIKGDLEKPDEVFLPLSHPCGEAQVDFGETSFYENGKLHKGYHLALTLPHSDAKFVQLFKGQTWECLAQGLTDIFKSIGGVPTIIRFDNMSTAVKEIKKFGVREVTENFRRMQCHYNFSSNFCNPASGNEKGSVENYVGTSRRNYFVPVPAFDSLEKYNLELLDKCKKDLNRLHYKLNRNVEVLFEEDKAVLTPLPAYEFDCMTISAAVTNNYGKIKFVRNTYSTAGNYCNTKVQILVKAHTIEILDENSRSIIVHRRLYGENQESMNWAPYLSLLAKRPMALKYSGFYEELPEGSKAFLDTCELPKRKKVLAFLSEMNGVYGYSQTIQYMENALQYEVKDTEAFKCAFAFAANQPTSIKKNAVPKWLPPISEYPSNIGDYGKLMGGICNES